MEFIRENTDIDLTTYRLGISKEENGEISCYAIYMTGEAYFKDFKFGVEWFETVVIKGTSNAIEKVTNPAQSVWREFIARKYGEQYIAYYREFMFQYFTKKQEELNNAINLFDEEIIKLERSCNK